jgi:hypothetical protein
MDNDPELKEWTSDWQAGEDRDDSADAIRLYAEGRRGFMWTWVLGELTVGAIALPLLAYMGWMATDQIERWAMYLLALITVAAMCTGWWNWRGSLLASAKTTAEYVTISTERLRRMRQAWRIGWVVFAAEVAVFSVWIWNMLYAGGRAHTPFAERFSWAWLAFMSLAAVGFLVWMDRWIRRDEEKFALLKRELDIPDEPATSRGPHPPASGPGRESNLRAKRRSRNRAFPR